MRILSTSSLRWLLLGVNLAALVLVTSLGFGYVFVGVEPMISTATDPGEFLVRDRGVGNTSNPEFAEMMRILDKKPPVLPTKDDDGKRAPTRITDEVKKTPGPLKDYKIINVSIFGESRVAHVTDGELPSLEPSDEEVSTSRKTRRGRQSSSRSRRSRGRGKAKGPDGSVVWPMAEGTIFNPKTDITVRVDVVETRRSTESPDEGQHFVVYTDLKTNQQHFIAQDIDLGFDGLNTQELPEMEAEVDTNILGEVNRIRTPESEAEGDQK